MAFPNRVLALAGCALIAAACTQDTTTAPAPPVAAKVGIEALPSYFGDEYGTLTFAKHREFPNSACKLKVSLKGLWDDPLADDYYYLRASFSDPVGFIYDEDISRGTFRGEFLFSYLSYGSASLWLVYVNPRLPVLNATSLGTADLGSSNPDFKIANRCF